MHISPSMEKSLKKLTSFSIWVQPLQEMDHMKRHQNQISSCYICDGAVLYYMEQQTNKFQIKKTSIVLLILTYGCKTGTINAAMQKKIQDFENKSHRKLLGITEYRPLSYLSNYNIYQQIIYAYTNC